MASATPAPEWIWDAPRQKYRYWRADIRAWHFEDGLTVPVDYHEQATTHQPQNVNHEPRTLPTGTYPQNVPPDNRASGNWSNYNAVPDLTNLSLAETLEVTQDEEDVEDAADQSVGTRLQAEDSGKDQDYEKLDDRYQRRLLDFFKVGKVIKCLWPENLGDNDRGISVVADSRFRDEMFGSKIRWFVIVKNSKYHCLCVPIGTYGGRGVSKKGLIKGEHAIIYTGNKEPKASKDERPSSKKERGMRDSIQVLPNQREGGMDPMSRVHFGKVYTVEKNVKIYDYGAVHPQHVPLLISHYNALSKSEPTVAQAIPPSSSQHASQPLGGQGSTRRPSMASTQNPGVLQPTAPVAQGSYGYQHPSAHSMYGHQGLTTSVPMPPNPMYGQSAPAPTQSYKAPYKVSYTTGNQPAQPSTAGYTYSYQQPNATAPHAPEDEDENDEEEEEEDENVHEVPQPPTGKGKARADTFMSPHQHQY